MILIQYDEYKQKLNEIKPKLSQLKDALCLDKIKMQVEELEGLSSQAEFWNETENSHIVLQKTANLKTVIEKYDKLCTLYDDIETLLEMAIEENDESLFLEISESYETLEKDLQTQMLQTLLKGEYDKNNAIITFHSGAGGTEAQDWVEMLYRMYTRWCEKKGFKYKILDYLDGDEAGIKSACILIEGLNAYGFLKSEAGVHRLVRISPFDSSGRRHTSFASLEVMPEINDEIEININDSDLRVDTYRASGAGGQHINKTDSAVRITHIPTGIVVACQNERSQHQNRDMAMKMLKSKLIEIKEREHLEKIEDIKGEQKDIAWGSQIRSYVFMPYTLVKDHRTSFESGNVNAVMDGDIDGFINAYLKYQSNESLN